MQLKEFRDFKQNCIESLSQKAKYVCLAVDMWSSRRRGYMGVTAHWIDTETLARQNIAIACKRFKGTTGLFV